MVTEVGRRFRRRGYLALLIAGFVIPGGALAQDLFVPLQFSYSDPGARSMGFGGAFVALADDATAAFANPAGLVQLARPEVSVEARGWSYSTPFIEGGRLENAPSGFGIDTTAGLRTATAESDLTGLSFLSVVYPKGRWSVALYRHQWANFRFRGETQGLFAGGTNCCQERLLDQRSSTDLDFVSYGVAVARRVSDRISLGVGLVRYEGEFRSAATLFLTDDDSIPSLFARNSYLPNRSLLETRLTSDDSDFALTGGLLWRLSERWQFGAVYRQAPELDFDNELVAGQAGNFGVPPGTTLGRNEGVPLEFPRVVGAGLAYRAIDGGLTVTFQWDSIEYSNLLDSIPVDDQAVDDVRELHLGAEYVFLDSVPLVAVRLGAWLDPDHQVRATEVADEVLRALLPRGEDDMHYAAGLGVAFERFQIDLGVDVADRVDTVSLSAILSF